MSAGYGAWGYGLSSETSQGPVALAPRPLQGSRAPFLNDSVRAATYNVPEAGFASRVGQRATGSTGLVDPFSYGFAQQGPDHGRSASGSFHHSSNTSQERHETLMPPLAGDYGQIGGASGGAGKPVMRSVAHSSSFGNPLLSPASLASASPTLSAVSLSPGLNPMRSGMLPSPGLGPSAVRGSSPNFGHVRSGSAASGSTLYGASLGASDRILPSPTLQAVSGSDHIQAHHFQQHHHPQRQTQMCKFYGSGNCKFGDGCRFIHPGPSTAHERLAAFVAASAREQANHGVMNGPSGMLARPAIGRLPQVALSESGPAPGQKTALINSSKGLQQIYFGRKIQKTCRFWMRGTCRYVSGVVGLQTIPID